MTTTQNPVSARRSSVRVAAASLSVAALAVVGSVALSTGQEPVAAASAPTTTPTTTTPAKPGKPRRATFSPMVLDLQRGDIDGDGLEDAVQLVANQAAGVPDEIVVHWGSEGSQAHALTGGGEGGFEPFRDLDGDGDLEIVVGAGGGESAWWDVFTVTPAGPGIEVVKVHVAGAPADEVPSLNLYQSPGWLTSYDDGFRETAGTDVTVPATSGEVRDWVLDGTTLTSVPRSAG